MGGCARGDMLLQAESLPFFKQSSPASHETVIASEDVLWTDGEVQAQPPTSPHVLHSAPTGSRGISEPAPVLQGLVDDHGLIQPCFSSITSHSAPETLTLSSPSATILDLAVLSDIHTVSKIPNGLGVSGSFFAKDNSQPTLEEIPIHLTSSDNATEQAPNPHSSLFGPASWNFDFANKQTSVPTSDTTAPQDPNGESDGNIDIISKTTTNIETAQNITPTKLPESYYLTPPTDNTNNVFKVNHNVAINAPDENYSDDADDESEDDTSMADMDTLRQQFVAPPQSSSGCLIERRAAYGLRPPTNSFDRETFNGTGWHDQDETGDYDPELESRTRRFKRKRVVNGEGSHGLRRRSKALKKSREESAASAPNGEDIETSEDREQARTFQQADEELQNDENSIVPDENHDDVAAAENNRHKDLSATDELGVITTVSNSYGYLQRDEKKSADTTSISVPSQVGIPPGQKCFTIETSFCHPIHFNWEPPPVDSSTGEGSHLQCHFCYGDKTKALFYSMFGNGIEQKSVRVIDLGNDRGYGEVTGGWKQLDCPETRMCANCVLDRVKIIGCQTHEIRRIEECDPEQVNLNETMDKLVVEGSGPNENTQPFMPEQGWADERPLAEMGVHWCSVCPYPAFWECCTPSFINNDPSNEQSDHIPGCGLELCETCAYRMLGSPPPRFTIQRRGRRRGTKALSNLDTMIRFAQRDPEKYIDGVRADASFLMSDGEMMRMLAATPVTSHDALTRAEVKQFTEKTGSSGAGAQIVTDAKFGPFVDEGDSDNAEVIEMTPPRWKGKGKEVYKPELVEVFNVDEEEDDAAVEAEMEILRREARRPQFAGSSSKHPIRGY